MDLNAIFKERVRFPISDAELDRRYAAVSEEMKKQGIDMLLMSNDNQFLGGYTRYFTDNPIENAYPGSVLFFSDKELTFINSGGASKPMPPPWAQRKVTQRLGAPYFRTLGYTDSLDAELIVDQIKRRGVKCVGLVGMGLLSFAMINYIKENTSAELVDATRLVDDIKAIKSEEEIARCLESVKMHDDAMAYAQSIIKPGMYEYELYAELKKFLLNYGSEESLIMMGSAPGGAHTPFLRSFLQGRRICEGDDVILMIEASGPGGYYSELARTISLGEPTKELVDTFALAVKLQHEVAKITVPGTKLIDIYNFFNERLAEHGLPPEERLFAHGQGYDLVEFPGAMPGDDSVIKENMWLTIHPAFGNKHVFVNCTDNFLVKNGVATLIQTTPQTILRPTN